MNAPVRTLTAMPAAIQREYDSALAEFRADGRGGLLYDLENFTIGATGKRILPDLLRWAPEYDPPTWLAEHKYESRECEGWGDTAKAALDAVLEEVKRAANDYAMERYEDSMAGTS